MLKAMRNYAFGAAAATALFVIPISAFSQSIEVGPGGVRVYDGRGGGQCEQLRRACENKDALGGVDSRDSLLGANQIQGCFWGGSLGCDGTVGFERRGVGADSAADHRPA